MITYANDDCLIQQKRNKGRYIAKHGLSHTRLAAVQSNMMMRCYNPRSERYPRYGGRGITVCNAWKIPGLFFEWALQSGYKDDLTIERVDNNGNYDPTNCKWIPAREQATNKSNNTRLTLRGETHCLSEWVRITGYALRTIQWRMEHGWSDEQVLSTKPSRRNRVRGFGL